MKFFQPNLVGPIAVNLVCAQVDKDDLGCVPADCLEKVQGSNGVYIEVIKRPSRGKVMARLRGGMDKQRWADLLHASENLGAITNIKFVMVEVSVSVLQPVLISTGVALGAEEVGPVVVVNAVDVPILSTEVLYNF
jgi:hypothetical protein